MEEIRSKTPASYRLKTESRPTSYLYSLHFYLEWHTKQQVYTYKGGPRIGLQVGNAWAQKASFVTRLHTHLSLCARF